MKAVDTEVGTKFNIANGGVATILKYNKWDDVLVELSHGHKRVVQIGSLRRGEVTDRMIPSVYGIGIIGNGKYKPGRNGKHSMQYKSWNEMLKRCYSEKYQSKYPTYKGCSVCDEWLNLQNFGRWFDNNYVDGLHLDKDIKTKGNKQYSPSTCTFVTCADNTIEAHAKNYTVISPKGDIIKVYNMAEFCRVNGLSSGAMSCVCSGMAKQHHGWTKG